MADTAATAACGPSAPAVTSLGFRDALAIWLMHISLRTKRPGPPFVSKGGPGRVCNGGWR
ncbi:hypothetical protein GCM10009628_10260 [Paeniglutamicibacter kerguelensis]